MLCSVTYLFVLIILCLLGAENVRFKAKRIPSPQDYKKKIVEFSLYFQMEKSNTVDFNIRRCVVYSIMG